MSSHQDASKKSFLIWTTWFIASIFFAYQYVLRVMPSVIMQELTQQFDLDPVLFGQFSGIYYIGYAAMHLPLGILLDRYGPKKIMPICIAIAVIGLLPILFAKHWLYAIAGRCLIGIGSSGAILSAFKVIHQMFGAAKFTRMLSFTVTIGLIGAIYGGGPLNYLCATFGYKPVTIVLALLGIALGVIAYAVTPQFQSKTSTSVMSDIKEVLGNKKILLVCCLAGLMVGPLEGFADLWGKQFLELIYGFESNVAAGVSSTLFVGTCFGAPLLSYIAQQIKNDSITIFSAGMLMALCFFALLLGLGNAVSISLMFALVGMCCTYQTYAIYKASTYVKEHAIGLTTAVANMIIMVFGYAFHSTMGFVINMAGGTSSPQAFKYGVSVIPIGLLLGAIGFIAIYWQESKHENLLADAKA